MEDLELRNKVAELTAKMLAIREVTARLLAYEAARWETPKALFEDFSEAAIKRISAAQQKFGENLSESNLYFYETIQRKSTGWLALRRQC